MNFNSLTISRSFAFLFCFPAEPTTSEQLQQVQTPRRAGDPGELRIIEVFLCVLPIFLLQLRAAV